MDGNKDKALRCIRIAEQAISSGNKDRALKFIKIAQRLNHNLPLDSLFAECERLNSHSTASSSGVTKDKPGRIKEDDFKNYTEENVKLIRKIKKKSDYYSILGLEKNCSVEEIKKAYRKLCLKVHPDKNKAPGSEDAFKKVLLAFKCLSDDSSRRDYDRTRLVDEFDNSNYYNNQHSRRKRRNTTTAHYNFEDEFDQSDVYDQYDEFDEFEFEFESDEFDEFEYEFEFDEYDEFDQSDESVIILNNPILVLFLVLVFFFKYF